MRRNTANRTTSRIVLVVLTLAGACVVDRAAPAGPNCADVGVAALVVVALDARTGTVIVESADVTAQDGDYSSRGVRHGDMPTYAMALNRPGTYTVTVTAPGYQPWRRDGLVVPRGACNVETLSLAAWLTRSTPTTLVR